MIEFDGISRRPSIPMRIQIQRMDLKAFRERFKEPISGIMDTMKSWRGGPERSGLSGFPVMIFTTERSGGKHLFTRGTIEKALHDQLIDPFLAEDIFSTFSVMNLLDMHGRGQTLEELHIERIPLLEAPDDFMDIPSEDRKISLLEEKDIVKILRKTTEEMQAAREQRIKDLVEQKVRDRSWPYRNFRRK